MSAKALYDTNSTTINAAYKALSNAASATGLGRTVDDWMGEMTRIIQSLCLHES